MMLSPSAQCYDLIRRFEGFRAYPYRCAAGYDTIGFGHVLRAGETFPHGITHAEAEQLLRGDVAIAFAAVQRLLPVPLTQGQCDALVSFTFNLGAGALQRSTLRQVLLRGEVGCAADEFRRWVYGGGQKLQGLVRRREAEIIMFLG
jgi:lysozyme